ncbi:MAG TPA: EipA family protein, partial [Hyphomicrobiales bacterium]|nr:EipA family protein [Hyphomicrobiales bacterium]
TRNAGTHKVFWQGPSIGFDFGADGARTMILVYNLNSVDQIYARFAGVAGSAFLVGGVGVTVLSREQMITTPIRAGVGARLGVNVGYLKFTRRATWNPF